jgi:hypothetical protein
MTDAIQAFPLTIPGGGSVNSIFFTDCELGWSEVTQILLTFPPGCSNLVGIRVESGGAQLYPLKAGTFFTFDDFTLAIPVTNQIESGQWHVAGYNTDYYQHTVTAYFFYNYLYGDSASSGAILSGMSGD